MIDLQAIEPLASAELLIIERLAAALETCSRVDEIKDVRDRAMAIQLYTRKKAGGLAAAQSAGRVVTEATLKLAELYEAEESAPTRLPDRGPVIETAAERPGKEAIAEAADLDSAQLRRLRPVLKAPKAQVEKAKAAIEERGGIVTPTALLRDVKGATPVRKDRPINLKTNLNAPRVGSLMGDFSHLWRTSIAVDKLEPGTHEKLRNYIQQIMNGEIDP